MYTMIVGLSRDRKGLLARVKTMEKGIYYHIHSNEMTPYERRIHKKLTQQNGK